MMLLRKSILIAVLCGVLAGCGGPWSSGDRVLVAKCSYDSGFTGPRRYDVVVFKYPGKWRNGALDGGPMDNNTPKNYIKRLLGLPGELLAIFFGRVYRWTPPQGAPPPFDDLKDGNVNPNDLWHADYMHVDNENSRKWFEAGQFEIIRKPPSVMLTMRRIVYDNDFQAKDLKGKGERWKPEAKSTWKTDGKTGFAYEGKAEADIDWLYYQHLVRRDGNIPEVERRLITDTMAYNSYNRKPHNPHWVGDLMIEANVEVVAANGEFLYELNKGVYRYQARWDLATGQCNLKRIHNTSGEAKDLGSQATSVKSPGNYMLRFANVDARLTVWVDRALPFGDGVTYDPPEIRGKDERGPKADDLKPAKIGSKGANVRLTHVRLWRDTYYTAKASDKDYAVEPAQGAWSDPEQFGPFQNLAFSTLYVQPGHYLCLGDNSQESSDGRDWGLVPERLMLGRALVVYFPLDRIGLIR